MNVSKEIGTFLNRRIKAIQTVLRQINEGVISGTQRNKELWVNWLRKGFVSAPMEKNEAFKMIRTHVNNEIEKAATYEKDEHIVSELDMLRYDTWFAAFPLKIGGLMKAETGHAFPVRTYGTKQDIINAFEQTLSQSPTETKQDKTTNTMELELELEAIATATLLELELTQANTLNGGKYLKVYNEPFEDGRETITYKAKGKRWYKRFDDYEKRFERITKEEAYEGLLTRYESDEVIGYKKASVTKEQLITELDKSKKGQPVIIQVYN